MVFGTGNACGAINCTNNQKKTPHLSFFRFPKDPERSRKWLINCRRKDLLKKDTLYLYNNVKFCSLHFEQNQFMNEERKRLVWNAVPTLFEIPNKPPQLSLKRKLPQRAEDKTSKAVKLFCAAAENSVESAATSVPQTSVCSTQTDFEDEVGKLKQIIRVLEKRVKCKNTRIARLSSRLKRDKESAYCCRNRKQLVFQKDTVKKDKQIMKNIGSRYLKKDALELLLSQIRIPLKGKQGVRFKDENKLFALNVLYYSTQAYSFLSECFILPSVRTLQRYVECIQIKCGFSENIFRLLEQRVQQFSETDKLVNLSIDEMSLMSNLTYDSSSDTVVGYEDLGYMRTNKVANSVLVIMINGIFSSFKQPLLYYFSRGSLTAAHLIDIFCNVVKRLKDIGLIVKTCVTDQGPNFVDWRCKLGISQISPYFVHEGQKIYFFYDTPHLIKSIRNNLFRYNINYKSNVGCIGTASWRDISQLYATDCQRKFKLAPKLTKKAVELPAFSKMKVSSAVRVLSHTVAAGIETLVACGIMPSSATATADFCQKVNDIFDIFNGYSVKGPVALRNCITSASDHLEVLQELKPWIQSWKFVDADGKDCSMRIKCVKGLLSNIDALKMLSDEVLPGTKRYLLSRKINQDGLENFFSTIRQKGGFSSNPSPRQFSAAFNNCVLSRLLNSSTVASSNCEGIDWGQAILEVKSARSLCFSQLCSNAPSTSVGLPNVEIPVDLGEENSRMYVFGYMLKKLFSLHNCEKCRTSLVDSSQNLDSNDKLYCHFKSFTNNFGSLVICKKTVASFLIECENNMASVFHEHIHKINCGALFVDLLMNVPNFPSGCCDETKPLLIKLFVKVRLFYILKFQNRDLLAKNKQPNLKMKKFTHLGC